MSIDHPPDPTKPSSSDDAVRIGTLLTWLNRGVAGVLIVAVGCLAVVSFPNGQGPERNCGIDWLLWACGSERTFESTLYEAIEHSRRDFEEKHGEQFRPQVESFDGPLEFSPFEPVLFDPTAGD